MNDCPNAEMRDLLPDLLHDRLAANVQAEVTSHVAACADCREELELLRGVHGVLIARTPRVDVAWVVNALPKPPARTAARVPSRRTWADWRIAAAVTLLAVGGSSVALVTRGTAPSAGEQPSALAVRVPVTDTPATGGAAAPVAPAVIAPAPSRPAVTAVAVGRADPVETPGVGMAGHLADLDDRQLKALIDEIEQMKAVPITEPEPVLIKVDPRNSAVPEDL